MAKPTRLNTPHLHKILDVEDAEFIERMKHDEKNLSENWENVEPEMCLKCSGTGRDPSAPEAVRCEGCEGTGTWYIMYYGVSDSLPYAYTDEYGIDFLKQTCKAYREAHTEMQLRGETYTHLRPYLLPKTLEMELMARGIDPHAKTDKAKRHIANIIASEYPDFMCVNYKNF